MALMYYKLYKNIHRITLKTTNIQKKYINKKWKCKKDVNNIIKI